MEVKNERMWGRLGADSKPDMEDSIFENCLYPTFKVTMVACKALC